MQNATIADLYFQEEFSKLGLIYTQPRKRSICILRLPSGCDMLTAVHKSTSKEQDNATYILQL